MVKVNRPGSQKAGSANSSSDKQPQEAQTTPAAQPAGSGTDQKRGKQSTKSPRPTVGGSAVQGAKSTLPKELSTGTPTNQQPEYYNREMRRRMQHMGTGPYAERPTLDPRERKRKRQERLKERQDQIKRAVDARGPSRDVKLGRRNAYFLIGLIAAIIILIVVFVIVRHPF